jgi:hypothetical protein
VPPVDRSPAAAPANPHSPLSVSFRHRHQEFLRFLRRLDREFPKSLDLHLVLDNSSTHSHANVRTWLDAHPRSVSISFPPVPLS